MAFLTSPRSARTRRPRIARGLQPAIDGLESRRLLSLTFTKIAFCAPSSGGDRPHAQVETSPVQIKHGWETPDVVGAAGGPVARKH